MHLYQIYIQLRDGSEIAAFKWRGEPDKGVRVAMKHAPEWNLDAVSARAEKIEEEDHVHNLRVG